MLKPFHDDGLLPDFPFGTDFTETEQSLIPALKRLQLVAKSPLTLASLVMLGLAGGGEEDAALARMGLATPKTWQDWIYAKLLRGALRSKPLE